MSRNVTFQQISVSLKFDMHSNFLKCLYFNFKIYQKKIWYFLGYFNFGNLNFHPVGRQLSNVSDFAELNGRKPLYTWRERDERKIEGIGNAISG